MGTKGNRRAPKKSDKFEEPDLLVSVNDILKKAQDNGLYIDNALKIKDLISTFDDIVINVPNQAERHCELEYGDWKWIPPVEERWQHFITSIKFENND